MPGIDFQRIRTEINIEQVLDQLGFRPCTRSRNELRGPCPVHRSTYQRSRSFAVDVSCSRYYCHKCHSRGNVIELWAAVHQLTIYEAAIDLCQALGQEIPWRHRW